MKILLGLFFSMCFLIAHAERNVINVGDIINIHGHQAMVFVLDDTGVHGKAMYIGAFRGIDSPWCRNGKHIKKLLDMSNCENGKLNTEKVTLYANNNNAWLLFPVFSWCHSLGEEWFIPSLKELEAFINFWLGNEEVFNWDEESELEIDSSKPFFKEINQRLIDSGGIPFINGVYTSTIDKNGKVYVFNYNRIKNTWSLKRMSVTSLDQNCVGRAFINF